MISIIAQNIGCDNDNCTVYPNVYYVYYVSMCSSFALDISDLLFVPIIRTYTDMWGEGHDDKKDFPWLSAQGCPEYRNKYYIVVHVL